MGSANPPLLLDTHYWIWLQLGISDQFTEKVLTAIEKAASEGNVLLSIISIWELGMLEAKGRIQLHSPCEQWVREALEMPGLSGRSSHARNCSREQPIADAISWRPRRPDYRGHR